MTAILRPCVRCTSNIVYLLPTIEPTQRLVSWKVRCANCGADGTEATEAAVAAMRWNEANR